MDEKKFSSLDLSIAYIQKKSKLYKAGGYKKAKSLKRTRTDYEQHLFAFFIDLNICILPVYLWVIEFFLILTGIIPPKIFDLLFYLMYALLFVMSVIVLPVFTARAKGQSLGYYYMDLKLVQRNKHEVNGLTLIIRQILGFGIPLMIFGYFFKIIGVALWWIVNGAVVLGTPNQQSIVDLALGIYTVHEPDYNIKFESEVNEEKEEKAQSSNDICPIDLHIRSSYSDDGYYDVEELFKQAKELNLETISITDHNCARQNASAKRFSDLYGVQYIPGVEVDCQYGDLRVRVLGYYIDWTHQIFDLIERDSLKREKKLSLLRVRKFEEYSGITIDVDSLISNSRFQTITATDITNMAFNNERVRSLPFVKKYIDANANERQAMKSFKYHVFGKGGPCYVKANYPDIENVIRAIHEAGGIAVLAGWHTDYMEEQTINDIVGLGMDGIECFTPNVHDKTAITLLKIAKENKLLISCGSDYHGPTKQNRSLGVTNCPEKGLQYVRILTKPVNKVS